MCVGAQEFNAPEPLVVAPMLKRFTLVKNTEIFTLELTSTEPLALLKYKDIDPKIQRKFYHFSFWQLLKKKMFLSKTFEPLRSICLLETVHLMAILAYFMAVYVVWHMS